jgi:hypothetical protein
MWNVEEGEKTMVARDMETVNKFKSLLQGKVNWTLDKGRRLPRVGLCL